MSEPLSPSFLPDAHKPELLAGTSPLPYGNSVASFPHDVAFTSSGAGRSTEAASFPGGTTSNPSKQLDTILAQSTSTQQLTLRMVSTNLLSNTEATTGAIATTDGLSPPAGNAAASLPFVNSSPGSDSKLLPDLEGGLPRLGFISSENAILAPPTRDESTYNGVPKTDENGAEILQPTSSNETHPQSRTYAAYASSPSAAYDYSVYGDASSAGMNSWGVGGIGGTIGGGSLTPGQAADYAVRVWLGKGPEWVQQILGVPLSSKVMDDFADVIHGAVKKHGESPAESIQRQRYNIASSQHGEEVRNSIAYEFYHHNLTPAEHKALAVQLADGRKTLSQFRKEAAYSEPARQQVAEVFRQQHGFDPSQQDLDYASMKRGDGWSLQDYRQNEAHGERTANQLRDLIPAVQGRPYWDSDAGWVRWHQDQLGNGQENVQQIRKDLANWSAQNGLYDQIFEQVHGFTARPEDRIYAGNMIGNGWSVQDYRLNEAHSDRAWREYGDLLRHLTGAEPNGDQIKEIQDKIGHGATYESARRDLVYSPFGRLSVDKVFESLGIGKPDDRQYGVFQDWFAQGKSPAEVRVTAAHGYESSAALKDITLKVLGRTLSSEELANQQAELTNGKTLADVRYTLVHSTEGIARLTQVCVDCTTQQPTAQELSQYQSRQIAGASLSDLRYAIAFSPNTVSGLLPYYTKLADTLHETALSIEALGETKWVKTIQTALADGSLKRASINAVLNDAASLLQWVPEAGYVYETISNFASHHAALSALDNNRPIILAGDYEVFPGYREEFPIPTSADLERFILVTGDDPTIVVPIIEGLPIEERLPYIEKLTGLDPKQINEFITLYRATNPVALQFPHLGQTDGGPGTWDIRHEGLSAGQENYQIKTTGAPKDIAYVVAGADGKEVKFDGYDPNTGALLDAKRWTSWPLPGKDFSEKSVMDQINRQLPAANGRVVEWVVPSQATKERILEIFENRSFDAESNKIQIKVVPQ